LPRKSAQPARSMVARLLAEPCSRWEPGEVLDLAAVMLMSRHWPEPARQIGGSIALRFLNSRSGRGQCARHLALLGSSPDMHDLLKFAKWHRRPSKDTTAPLTRRVANTVMMEAIRAFATVCCAADNTSDDTDEQRSDADNHADQVMRVVLRRIQSPLYRSTRGRKMLGPSFTLADVEAARVSLIPRMGARVTYSQLADEILQRMVETPRKNRPKKRTVINRISLLSSRNVSEDYALSQQTAQVLGLPAEASAQPIRLPLRPGLIESAMTAGRDAMRH
jgi:hypothetical protein